MNTGLEIRTSDDYISIGAGYDVATGTYSTAALSYVDITATEISLGRPSSTVYVLGNIEGYAPATGDPFTSTIKNFIMEDGIIDGGVY